MPTPLASELSQYLPFSTGVGLWKKTDSLPAWCLSFNPSANVFLASERLSRCQAMCVSYISLVKL